LTASPFIPCLQDDAAARIAGKSGIVESARSGNAALVFLHLVANSRCVNSKVVSGDTPLHVCAEHGHVETCRLLLQCNANASAKNRL
jgi:ankyrin repeat protein